MRNHKIIIFFVSALFSIILTSRTYSASYYVDYLNGSDTNIGTSTATPWQHCPGDANATNSAKITLSPGDTVIFKGGVRYAGKIAVNASGTSGSRITFQGQPSGWGTGKAIIDGTATATWTQCASAAACGNNPNYTNIYYTALPGGSAVDIPVFDSDVPLGYQIDVTVADKLLDAVVEEWHSTTSTVTATTAVNSAVFTSSNSDYYTGAYFYLHQWSGNSKVRGKITSFNPSTHTITFDNLGYTPSVDSSWDNKFHYAILNNYRAISSSGTYAVDEANSRIYVWPSTSSSNLRIGSLSYGFDISSRSYITIDGFKIIGQYTTLNGSTGIAIFGSNSTPVNGLDIKNNDMIGQSGTFPSTAVGNVYFRSEGTADSYFRNNTMYSANNSRGLLVFGNKIYTQNNLFEYIKGTVIFYFAFPGVATADGEIDGNTIQNCQGIHANGMALYGFGTTPVERIVIKNNKTLGFGSRAGPYAATMQIHRDLTFYNNVFGETQEQGRVSGCNYMRFYNNTLLDFYKTDDGHNEGLVITENPANCTEYTVKGNIMDGFGSAKGYPTHKYNIYVNYYWTQETSTYGWVLDPTERTSTITAVFNNVAGNDYSLKAGSPAIDFLPTAQAPSATFSTDIIGKPRPQGSSWDAGAYEGEGNAPDILAPKGLKLIQ